MMRKARISLVLAFLALALLATSGRFLVVNQPRQSDVIVVLAGETEHRPARGVELFTQGYAPRLILNVQESKIYQWNEAELAQKYVEALGRAQFITICRIDGLSTKEEAIDSRRCLQQVGGKNVLLVTSDYHTRRALSIFKHEVPERNFSIAAAFDAREFGVRWWQHREWAKVNFYEWLRLLWWELVDRWR
ncbi:MAG: hypothetical protein DMG86_19390 [Acidobacteria bacterium]|nr:MAG: hypothetical protein DMG86_19390 [Acidobacteriota bacterium]PYX12103.1 MAG: hypothetical protein DMG84_22480 [Acidobacteriota bacterium]